MESIWATSSFPQERSVLRLRLRPYCAGHEINLCAIESPFAMGGDVSFDDLFTAVLLCSQTFDEGQKIIRNPRSSKSFGFIWGLFLRLTWKAELFHVELHNFRQHLKNGSWCPPTNQAIAGVSTRTLKAPRVYRLIPFLCGNLGMSESEALNFPMARANAYYAALADKAGEIDLQGEEDESIFAYAADLESRAAKGENVWGS